MDELLVRIEDECRWTSGNWPHGSLAENAVTARVSAGFFRDVWAVAQNRNKDNRQRSLAMAVCIASALLRPLKAADTDVKTVLGHDEFQRLVDEARAELHRARAMRLVDDEFQWHITDEVRPKRDSPDTPDEVIPSKRRQADESDEEYVPYEEYRTKKDGEKGEKKDDDRMSGSSESQ